MTQQDQQFLKKLQAAFRVEADEHLHAITSGLLELEHVVETALRQDLIATIFREAHSLKGAARTVNADRIEMICQGLEGVFASWRRQGFAPSASSLDPLHGAVNAIGTLLSSPQGADPAANIASISQLLQQLSDLSTEPASPNPAAPSVLPDNPPRSEPDRTTSTPIRAPVAETLRISAAKLDALLLQAEEMLSVKLAAHQRAADLSGLRDLFLDCEKQWTKLSNACANGDPPAAIREHVAALRAQLPSMSAKISALASAADHDRRMVGLLTDGLLDDSKKLRMQPCATLFESFPKLVRDLSRDQGKDVELILHGSEIEIDKRILDELKDPLVHLLRNSIDHGIESSETRTRSNKPAHGTITVAASQTEGNVVEILVSDDGKGMDPEQLRRAAVRQRILTETQAHTLPLKEALDLAFRSEITTSPIITEISGRGLGLAIVKERTQKLGGRIDVETRPGHGTAFRLRLPITLATFRGIAFEAAGHQFVLPSSSVERIARVPASGVRTVENRETILLEDRPVSLARLANVLNLRSPPQPPDASLPVLVLNAADHRMVFAVSQVIGEQEVLVKPLAKPLLRVRNVAGATILGTGKVVLILNPTDLMKSAMVTESALQSPAESFEPEKARSVLVVGDSITARMLLKNILASAGYRVTTAVDGLDALGALRSEDFDLVVSDVEMPRMGGFDLTARIRQDKKLAELPVVLVTGLASQQDRARGIDVGASAYIVKSSFDQSNLLEVIGRLV